MQLGRHSAAKPQRNVRPSSGAETSDGYTCGTMSERRTSLELLRPGTAALQNFHRGLRTISAITVQDSQKGPGREVRRCFAWDQNPSVLRTRHHSPSDDQWE